MPVLANDIIRLELVPVPAVGCSAPPANLHGLSA